MGAFDDILNQFVSDEADRAVILKYQPLASKFDTAVDLNTKNQAWFATHYDWDAGKTIREKELEVAIEAEKERTAALAATGNSEMTFEQIEASLKSKGYVSKAEVDSQIAAATTGVKQFIAERDLGAMKFAAETATLAISHQQEFGAPLDANGFATFTAQSNAQTPRVAYDQYVATMRSEAQTKKLADMQTQHAADLERVKAESSETARRQALMEVAQGGGGMPVDQGKGSGSLGWMQQRQIDRTKLVDADGNQQVPGGRLGDGSAANAAYTQYLKDKADGKVLGSVQ